MKYKKSDLIPVAVSLGILVFAVAILIQATNIPSGGPNNLLLGLYGHVCVWVNDELLECGPNVITRAGANMTRDMLTFINTSFVAAGINGTQYISLSNEASVSSAEKSACPAEITASGLGRAQGTIYHVPNYTIAASNISISNKFTATATQAVQKTCLSNSSAALASILIAEDNFTSVTLNSGDTINITWYIGVA